MPASGGPVDEVHRLGDVAVQVAYRGRVVQVTREAFTFAGQSVERDVVRHPGAVGVVALRQRHDGLEVLLVRQYRHPMGEYMWELPAGLRDVPGEDSAECARRELREEAGYEAGELMPLLDCATTPGGSDEVISLFLAWEPTPLPARLATAEAEEQDMVSQWFPLGSVVEAVSSGRLRNMAAQVGALAAALWAREGRFPPS